VVHTESVASQQHGQSLVAEPRSLCGVLKQPFFETGDLSLSALVTIGGSVLPRQPAGAPFA